MSNIHAVSARSLAEFALEKGDLFPGGSLKRMQEGVRGHQALQSLLPFDWQSEAPVSRDLAINGEVLRVHGRADAVHIGRVAVEVMEIKTTTRDLGRILKYDYPVHWAQAEIYAALFCMNHGLPAAEVQLVYARSDGQTRVFRQDYEAEALIERLMGYARPYMDWICAVDTRKDQSRATLDRLPFPYPEYREGQRDMARAVYRAMKDHSSVLVEAPTGIGKTAASLFGALRALGRGHVTSIFYLTARTTGRRAAEDALERMRKDAVALRSVTITAKEKCCLLEKPDCMGCPYASEYYDRRRAALKEALYIQRLDAEAIHALALEHELCPFELSLDMSETADVVICDYNYAFDPRVRLKRFFDTRSGAGLLVDEAHNLADRAREMLSAELSGERVDALRRKLAAFEGDRSPMVELMSQLTAALRSPEDLEPEALDAPPEAMAQAIRRFAEAAGELQSAEPDVRDLIFDTQWFVKVLQRFDADCYRAMVLPGEKWLTLRLWCFDPSGHLRRTFSRVGGAALFSATLAPMDFYAAQLGVDGEGDAQLQLESPFPRENMAVYRLPVAASLRERERTKHAVAQVIHAMAEARTGNYLACFPSYAYMNLVFRHYRMLWPYDAAICQEPHMGEKARMDFIERFQPEPKRSLVGFIVLGGVFAEGVDLPGDRLSGAAIVSTGMPQISFEREVLRDRLDVAADGGMDAAYTYPGLRRVLQAAGRVIRTERDRGVVVLMDQRYRQERMMELLPSHWEVSDVKKLSELKEKMRRFWLDADETDQSFEFNSTKGAGKRENSGRDR